MEQLMESIAQGNRTAFEKLFRTYYVPLCVYAESLLHDKEQAEDLVQGIFCDLWEKRAKLHIHESFQSYLFRAAYNAALNLLKHEKVKSEFLKFVREHEVAGENNTESFFLREEQSFMLNEINRAIEALPGQCREIFLLSRFAGKKSADIASTLGISVRTVETQLYRAMKQLRVALSHLRNADIYLFLHLPALD